MSNDELAPKLKERDRWVCWTYETRDGEETKPPIAPFDGQRYASTTDPDTWGSYEGAVAYHERDDTDTEGVGYVLGDGDMVAGADLDGCRVPETGKKEPWAEEIIERLDSYTEISPSGTGLRIFVVALMPDGGNRKPQKQTLEAIEDCKKESELELYDEGRYLTFTGDHLEGTPTTVEQRNSAFKAVHEEYIAANDEQSTLNETVAQTAPALDLTDEEILDKARNAENGEKFKQLERGHDPPSDKKKGGDTSYGDKAFCQLLGFWTGGDRQQIDRLFRNSGRMRSKWDEDRGAQTYGNRTIDAALADQTEFYDPTTGDSPTAEDAAADGGVAAVNPQGSTGEEASPVGKQLVKEWKRIRTCYGDRQTRDDARYNAMRNCEAEMTFLAGEENQQLRLYDDDRGFYTVHAEQRVRTYLADDERLRQVYRRSRGDQIVKILIDRSAMPVDKLGGPLELLCFGNTLLDISVPTNPKPKPHTPEKKFTAGYPVDYDPTAEYEDTRWIEFIQETVDPQDVDKLQEFMGYSLLHDQQPFKKAAFLVGPENSGKGTILRVLTALLGKENISSETLKNLVNTSGGARWAAHSLFGAVANIRNEVTPGALKNVQRFKELIGGEDRIDAEDKGKPKYEFTVTQKFLFATNQFPDVQHADSAFYDRLLFISCPNTVPEERRDPDLLDELLEEESAILNWMLNGLARLLEQEAFSDVRDQRTKESLVDEFGGPIDRFVHACIDVTGDEDDIVHKGDLHDLMLAYATRCGFDERPTQGQFTKKLKTNEGVNDKSARFDGSDPEKAFTGIRVEPKATTAFEVDVKSRTSDGHVSGGHKDTL